MSLVGVPASSFVIKDPIWSDPMFQAVKFPAGVSYLHAGLAYVYLDDLPLKCVRLDCSARFCKLEIITYIRRHCFCVHLNFWFSLILKWFFSFCSCWNFGVTSDSFVNFWFCWLLSSDSTKIITQNNHEIFKKKKYIF